MMHDLAFIGFKTMEDWAEHVQSWREYALCGIMMEQQQAGHTINVIAQTVKREFTPCIFYCKLRVGYITSTDLWKSPKEDADARGAADTALAVVIDWIRDQGLTVVKAAPDNTALYEMEGTCEFMWYEKKQNMYKRVSREEYRSLRHALAVRKLGREE